MRLIIGLLLKTGMIVFLNWIGWITLMSGGRVAEGAKEIVAVALAGAVIFTVVAVLTLLLSFGLAAFLWVFFGGLILWIMAQLAPGFIQLNAGFWLTVLSGFLILAATLPDRFGGTRRPRVGTAR